MNSCLVKVLPAATPSGIFARYLANLVLIGFYTSHNQWQGTHECQMPCQTLSQVMSVCLVV
jgi:hypothetical protein